MSHASPQRCPPNRGKPRTVRSRIHRGRNPLLIFQFAVDQTIARGAIWNDIRLTDNASRFHFEWLENPFLKNVSVELAGHFMDDNPKRYVAKIAITPLFSRWRQKGIRLYAPQQLVLSIVTGKV